MLSMAMAIIGCQPKNKDKGEQDMEKGTSVDSDYEKDVNFLQKHLEVIELTNSENTGKIAISPALQGRVMTSTAGRTGSSYGWLNKPYFEAGELSEHINVYGGEERFWLGPEGGQYSIFFESGKEFTLENWYTPKVIDLEPYEVKDSSSIEVVFTKSTQLTNYSGFTFVMDIERKVQILENIDIIKQLGLSDLDGVQSVGYQTTNRLTNTGKGTWNKKDGLLSIWLLGMFTPSPTTTVMIPYRTDAEGGSGKVVNIYESFGQIPDNRLITTENMVYFSGDGQYRSKIGLLPDRAKDVLGAYDAKNGVLTLVKYNKPDGISDYVNSTWEIQEEPYKGDVVNSYNDGAPEPGAKPLGPFYELETSSPALALAPGETAEHIQMTFHLEGTPEILGGVIKQVFGVDAKDVPVFDQID
ncbi:hypothetical protein L0P88_13245 [Muricauda sp. SCSIO 64092]|uniref:DUF6786 family protein n=1 Tax=Allomuricauda sp. SCSIO 64092 TaxID=2908842 RepID=UPI001FF357F7|nr:DUF6786 family protein [Muricauda sp. SCSIO 64092]UOY04916.1 hypothetical protein L0P88_13245 [Muricauda sp. SCSIO 64092]